MIYISQEELLKDIEEARGNILRLPTKNKSLYSASSGVSSSSNSSCLIDNMSSILPKSCTSRRDGNNNPTGDDEVQAVIITGECYNL